MKQWGMIALLAACSGTALADENRFYAGGNVGQASAEWVDLGGLRAAANASGGNIISRDDTRGTGFKIYGGYHFNDVVDFRAGYANLGETVSGVGDGNGSGAYIDFTNKTQTLFVDVLTRFQPVDRLTLFTKLGFDLTKNDISTQTSNAGAPPGLVLPDDTDYGFAFVPGIGVSYDITPQIGVVAEYEVYANMGKTHSEASAVALNIGSIPKNDVSLLSLGAYYHF